MAWAYLYDGSWEGLLTAVFRAFATKEWPGSIHVRENAQLAFEEQPVEITADPLKARRVEKGILRHMGSPAHQKVWTAFLSGDPDKSTIIYRYICAGIEKGRGIYSALAHADVLAIDRLELNIRNEAHHLQGFVRFSLMDNGVYFGRISPKNNVLPLLMPFFADRYGDQPLLLFDKGHQLAGVYDRRGWYLVETDQVTLPGLAEEEIPFRRLWREFYHAIAVESRINPRLRRGNMPKRFWGNMTEFNPDKAR